MKKTIALLLALMMTVTVLAGCNNQTEPESTPGPSGTTEGTTASSGSHDSDTSEETTLQILENIWNRIPEADRFPTVGGDTGHMVDDAPGGFDVTNTEELKATLLVDESLVAQVTEAASLVHLMNANVFTGGVLRVSGDIRAFADTMKETIANNRWMCGQPDGYLLAQVNEDTLMMAFGSSDALEPLRTSLMAAYPATEILHDDVIA